MSNYEHGFFDSSLSPPSKNAAKALGAVTEAVIQAKRANPFQNPIT